MRLALPALACLLTVPLASADPGLPDVETALAPCVPGTSLSPVAASVGIDGAAWFVPQGYGLDGVWRGLWCHVSF